MTIATFSLRAPVLRRSLPIVLAVGALAVMTSQAHAAELDKLSIDTPVVKVIGRDMATDAPIENVTVVARIIPDPETLTTDSGVALLNDYVHEAAREACFAAGPTVPDDGTCMRKALQDAKPQVAALIAHANRTNQGSTAVGR